MAETSLLRFIVALTLFSFAQCCSTVNSNNRYHHTHYSGFYEPYFNYHRGYHHVYDPYVYRGPLGGHDGSYFVTTGFDEFVGRLRWGDRLVRYAALMEESPPPVAAAMTKSAQPVHPSSWSDANCTYTLTTPALRWIDARNDCAKRGAHLAVLATARAASRAFAEFGVNSTASFWIGASDNANEDVWGWVDGKMVVFAYWKESGPVGGEERNCAAMDVAADGDGRWSDQDCDEKKPYLCQSC